MLEERRLLRECYDTNLKRLRGLNKNFSKAIRKSVRKYNINEISKVIEQNRILKIFWQKQSTVKTNICKLKNTQGDRGNFLERRKIFL